MIHAAFDAQDLRRLDELDDLEKTNNEFRTGKWLFKQYLHLWNYGR